MRVRFFATLRSITGCAEADIPYRETAGDLARSLCDQYGNKLREKIFPASDTQFGPEIIILINGRHVCHLGGPAAPLDSEDRVDVFPVVAGG